MDPSTFDTFTKALTTSTSRRQTLKIIAAAMGGILGLSEGGTAFAKCKKAGDKCTRNRECCGFHCCDGRCCDVDKKCCGEKFGVCCPKSRLWLCCGKRLAGCCKKFGTPPDQSTCNEECCESGEWKKKTQECK